MSDAYSLFVHACTAVADHLEGHVAVDFRAARTDVTAKLPPFLAWVAKHSHLMQQLKFFVDMFPANLIPADAHAALAAALQQGARLRGALPLQHVSFLTMCSAAVLEQLSPRHLTSLCSVNFGEVHQPGRAVQALSRLTGGWIAWW